jgi:ABC-2 type transport system permease protein
MSASLAIARREMGSYFRTPAGWVIIALFLFLTGMVVGRFVLQPGLPATMRDFFAASGWLLLPVAPAISMRLLAEEWRTGSIESLMSAPVSGWGIVVGKFLGALGFLLTMLAPTLVHVLVLQRVSTLPLDPGPILSGYACLLLLGALYVSIGTFASALTHNATLAFLGALFAVLALMLAPAASAFLPPWARPGVLVFSLSERIGDFARGVIDSAHVVFFATLSLWFLVLGACAVEARRWWAA